jgi:stalled ribosome rescue protein Dom34
MNVGLWLDNKKAIIVTIENKEASTHIIESHIEKLVKSSGGTRSSASNGPQDVASEQQRDEKFKHHLHDYYKKIIEYIKNCEKVFIFGPGEPKKELRKEIEKIESLLGVFAGIEASDKLTEPQIVAKVKKFYGYL